jgi:hypothetical protein
VGHLVDVAAFEGGAQLDGVGVDEVELRDIDAESDVVLGEGEGAGLGAREGEPVVVDAGEVVVMEELAVSFLCKSKVDKMFKLSFLFIMISD